MRTFVRQLLISITIDGLTKILSSFLQTTIDCQPTTNWSEIL